MTKKLTIKEDLASAYRDMAVDEVREREAREWSENLVGDVADETPSTRALDRSRRS